MRRCRWPPLVSTPPLCCVPASAAATSCARPPRSVPPASLQPVRPDPRKPTYREKVLQPGKGPIHGRHYLRSHAGPGPVGLRPVARQRAGADDALRARRSPSTPSRTRASSRTRDAIRSGTSPSTAYGGRPVLDDAVAIARDYDRTTRNFDVDGPHVVTGPIFVKDAKPGDVLKIEMLSMLPRVPYGVVSSRHGKGALPRLGRRRCPGRDHRRRDHAAGRRPTAGPPATRPSTATSRYSRRSRGRAGDAVMSRGAR